jgi:hypothetical protein
MYRLLLSRTISEKMPKIPLFGPSLNYQLRLLGSQPHPQSGVHLTSFSIWGTENSLAEINLENMGGEKVATFFGGQKLANTGSFVGGGIIVQQEIISRARTQLGEPAKCASGGDPLLLYKFLHLEFFPLVRILCALRLESRKKIINMVLMQDRWNFSFFGRGDVSPIHSKSVTLFRGHRQNTKSHLP